MNSCGSEKYPVLGSRGYSIELWGSKNAGELVFIRENTVFSYHWLGLSEWIAFLVPVKVKDFVICLLYCVKWNEWYHGKCHHKHFTV